MLAIFAVLKNCGLFLEIRQTSWLKVEFTLKKNFMHASVEMEIDLQN